MIFSLKRFTAITVMLALASYLSTLSTEAETKISDARLKEIIDARSEDKKVRDQYRLPFETMKFFEIDEGQKIVEVHVGPWYSEIIFPIIGPEGHFIAAEIAPETYTKYRNTRTYEEYVKFYDDWYGRFPEWIERQPCANLQPKFSRIWQKQAPEELYDTVDRYLFFRILHHTARLSDEEFRAVIDEAYQLLKPGGIVGVIQHLAPEGHSDEWADGSNGYMKRSRVIEAFTAAGFHLEAESEMHRNPKDQPKDKNGDEPGDKVWRLPPSSTDFVEIGESDRMTLKFRKLPG